MEQESTVAERAEALSLTRARLFDLLPISLPREIHVSKDQRLTWHWLPEGGAARTAAPDAAMLDAFTGLSDATAETIASFARVWGVLAPRDFEPERQPERQGHYAPPYDPPRTDIVRNSNGTRFTADAEDWRRCARSAQAILRVASRLRDQQKGHAGDWSIIAPHRQVAINNVRRERQELARLLSGWLAWDGALLSIAWDRPTARLQLQPQSLIGAVAALLFNAIEAAEGFVLCASCGRPFVPIKRQGEGRRHYCPDCGRKAAVREASRAFRARHREAAPRE